MRALTIWQPWASLIMAGAKAYEFRRWDYRTRDPSLIGQRIVIHAGKRPMVASEIGDLMERLEDGYSALDPVRAWPLLKRICQHAKPAHALTLAAGIGTAVLGDPQPAALLFRDRVTDSSRLDQHMWAWPLTDVVPWDEPVPCRGLQGFWAWPFALREAA